MKASIVHHLRRLLLVAAIANGMGSDAASSTVGGFVLPPLRATAAVAFAHAPPSTTRTTASCVIARRLPFSSSSTSSFLRLEARRGKDEKRRGATATDVGVDDIISPSPHAVDDDVFIIDDSYDVTAIDSIVEENDDEEKDEGRMRDEEMMSHIVSMVGNVVGGERAISGPYPGPVCGAMLVAEDGRVSFFYLAGDRGIGSGVVCCCSVVAFVLRPCIRSARSHTPPL
jgi:hypothetical protein